MQHPLPQRIALAVKPTILSGFMALSVFGEASETVETLYQNACSACHGKTLQGGQAGPLLGQTWHLKKSSDIEQVIKNGITESGMPAFGGFDDATVRAMAVFIKERSYFAQKDRKALYPAPPSDETFQARDHSFQIEKVFEANQQVWALEPLPNETFIATQKEGTLLLFDKHNGRQVIKGIPKVRFYAQGGLLDVQAHPDYEKNGWIYLSFSRVGKGDTGNTEIVRGKIKQGKWVEQQTIYSAADKFLQKAGHHYGSRLAFLNGYLYFSIGDRSQAESAQDLSWPTGKIHRLHDDGRIPKDNPFTRTKGALPSIWSYGHRNPQGLTSNSNGDLWQSEHGPRGGDEINLITKGSNYGWPLHTYGIHYSGQPFPWQLDGVDTTLPIYHWVPSPGISNLAYYPGQAFPKWRNNLLVTSLGKQELHRLRLEGNRVVDDEILFENYGHIRDIAISRDGTIYLAIFNVDPKHPGGAIYRIKPINSRGV